MTRKYWKQICAIPTYMFLLSPSGNRVQKLDGGNWIDQHEAQKVIDAAEDELSGLIAENEALRKNARRYEWLRDKQTFIWLIQDWFPGAAEFTDVDAEIDTAMSKEG